MVAEQRPSDNWTTTEVGPNDGWWPNGQGKRVAKRGSDNRAPDGNRDGRWTGWQRRNIKPRRRNYQEERKKEEKEGSGWEWDTQGRINHKRNETEKQKMKKKREGHVLKFQQLEGMQWNFRSLMAECRISNIEGIRLNFIRVHNKISKTGG